MKYERFFTVQILKKPGGQQGGTHQSEYQPVLKLPRYLIAPVKIAIIAFFKVSNFES
jgi:hypothetical protein